jgi:hypothetical protein
MPSNIPLTVMRVKGWENPQRGMKCSYNPKYKWGLDFVGPTDPPSEQNKYILLCKWGEVKEMKVAIKQKVVEFLQENIFSRF